MSNCEQTWQKYCIIAHDFMQIKPPAHTQFNSGRVIGFKNLDEASVLNLQY